MGVMKQYKWVWLSLSAIALAFIVLRLIATDWADGFKSFDFVTTRNGKVEVIKDPPQDSTTLAVVVHGMSRGPQNMHDIVRRLQEIDDKTDVIAPKFYAEPLSNANLNKLGAQLDLAIQEKIDQAPGKYSKVILVGHSMGAVMVKRAYLFAKGCRSDYPLSQDKPTSCGDNAGRDNNWSRLTENGRIILLAGMNNGWNIYPRPRDMRKSRWLALKYGSLFGAITGTGKLSLSLRRGSPLISNLRYDWISLAKLARQNNQRIAQIVQILGDNDDLVSRADSMDLTASDGFVFMEALGTFHGNIIQLFDKPCVDHNGCDSNEVRDNPDFIAQRNDLFTKSITEPVVELRSNPAYQFNQPDTDQSVTRLVLVAHGIRDIGEWTSTFKREIEQENPNTRVMPVRYGYFGMINFLFRWDRQQYVRWFVEQYIEAHVTYPNLREVSFIGHSHGTYLLASALEQYKFIRFENIYFAGSVVRRGFPWKNFLGSRVARLRNDMAAGDAVVATLPRIFEYLSLIPFTDRFFDLGSGGFSGFTNIGPEQDAYLPVPNFKGGHGAALETQLNLQSIKSFIIQDNMNEPQGREPHNATYYRVLQFLWAFPLVWLIIVVIVAALGRLVWLGADRISRSKLVVKVLAVIIYVIAFPLTINLI